MDALQELQELSHQVNEAFDGLANGEGALAPQGHDYLDGEPPQIRVLELDGAARQELEREGGQFRVIAAVRIG